MFHVKHCVIRECERPGYRKGDSMLHLQTIYEAEITGYTSDGRGVAHIEGCAVFIPNAICGEYCTVRILHLGKHSAIGKIEQILRKSPHRISKACPYAKQCGGNCGTSKTN